MSQPQSAPAGTAPLVVFDFDHTLYNGDSGSHLYLWLIRRNWWRVLLALLLCGGIWVAAIVQRIFHG